jgi:hypothetical protein
MSRADFYRGYYRRDADLNEAACAADAARGVFRQAGRIGVLSKNDE